MSYTRNILFFLILMCFSLVAAAASEIAVDVRREGEKVIVAASYTVAVPREIVWEVMTDFEHMSEFMPQMSSSKVVSRDGNTLRVNQKGAVPVSFFDMTYDSTRELELKPMAEIRGHSVGGDSGPLKSVSTLAAHDLRTTVNYHAEWIPSSRLMASFGQDIMREQIIQQFGAMQVEMLKRAKRRPLASASAAM